MLSIRCASVYVQQVPIPNCGGEEEEEQKKQQQQQQRQQYNK